MLGGLDGSVSPRRELGGARRKPCAPAGLITWPERSALSISVPEMLKQLGYQRIETVSLNLGVQLTGDAGKEAGSPGRLRYADGERVQPQTLRPPSP